MVKAVWLSMELEIHEQLWALVTAALCGAAVGLVYDVLRPFRYRSGKLLQTVLDLLFCIAAFMAAFIYGQYTYKGRLGAWEAAGLALGFWAYMNSISAIFLEIFKGLLELFCGIISGFKGLLKKSHDFLKLYFQKEQ